MVHDDHHVDQSRHSHTYLVLKVSTHNQELFLSMGYRTGLITLSKLGGGGGEEQ